MLAKSLQLCPTLCDPMDRSLPGFSVYGILLARVLERVAMRPLQGIFLDPEIEPMSLRSPALAGRFFTTSTTWEILRHRRDTLPLNSQTQERHSALPGEPRLCSHLKYPVRVL